MAGPASAAHGPMLIGTIFNTLLYGVMIAQVYSYYTSYRRDKLFLKLLVLTIFLVDTMNSIFDIVYMYVCLILHFGDGPYLQRTNWQFATGPAITGASSLMVQLFFAWRIHLLTKNRFLVGIVSILSLASAVCAFIVSWEVTVIPQFVRFQQFKGVVIVWLSCAAAADITITTILRKHKTGFKKSDMVVDRIIRMTVQTGLATSVVATIDLVLYLASTSGLHLLFNFSLTLLYSNSLISSLNARDRLRHEGSTSENVYSEGHGHSKSHDHATDGWHDHDATVSRRTREKSQTILDSMVPQRTGVFVHVESHEMRDIESHGRDFPAPTKKVVIPSDDTSYGTQDKIMEHSFSSLSDTCDHKGSAV